MPTFGEIFMFIFRHGQWRERQEVQEFLRMAVAIAEYDGTINVPKINAILRNPGQALRSIKKKGFIWQMWLLSEIPLSSLVDIHDECKSIEIPERPFGRSIPIRELVDFIVGHYDEPVEIIASPKGLVAKLASGYSLKLPSCSIYLGRLEEDGMRYRNTCILIGKLTDEAVSLDWKELVGRTDLIYLKKVGGTWNVDTGVPCSTA